MYRTALVLLLGFVSCNVFAQDISRKSLPVIVVPRNLSPDEIRQFQRQFAKPLSTPEEIDRRFAAESIYRGSFLENKSAKESRIFVDVALEFFFTDPCPKERLEEFEYCLQSKDVAIVRWNGIVTSITSKEGGRHLITMNVKPELVGRDGGLVMTPKTCTEIWEWDGKNLKFLRRAASNGLDAILTL